MRAGRIFTEGVFAYVPRRARERRLQKGLWHIQRQSVVPVWFLCKEQATLKSHALGLVKTRIHSGT